MIWDVFGVQGFPEDNTIESILQLFFPEICEVTPWICENVIFLFVGCNSMSKSSITQEILSSSRFM
jgi:hypothetical protein